MSTTANKEALIIRIAEIVIFELKLEDITSETFDPDLDLESGDEGDLAAMGRVFGEELPSGLVLRLSTLGLLEMWLSIRR